MTAPRPVSVRGGSAGIEAHSEDLTQLARLFGSVAHECGWRSLDLHRVFAHPAVLASTLLDPWGAAKFEAELLTALDGPRGLTVLCARCSALDVHLRSAAMTYVLADRAAAQFGPALKGISELVQALPGGPGPGPSPSGVRAASGLKGFFATNPEVADLAVDFITSFWGNYALVGLAAAWPDGRPRVTSRGDDPSAAARRPPRSLRDIMFGLSNRNQGPAGGDIDVRVVTSTGSYGTPQRRFIVDIPGTRNWSVSPREPDPTSLGTNLRAIAAASTTYGAAVIMALRRAGVRRGEPILIAGHSQGAMVALEVSREVRRSGEFDVTHVISAGAPIGRMPIPGGVQVLAIENDGDVIPHCDGAQNPGRRNETTVQIHRDTGDISANHDLSASYVPGAGDIDASDDPSVRTYLGGLEPFLAGTAVRTEVYHVERR